MFKTYNLSITIEANLKSVNFLDVQLDLERDAYRPYIKPNDKPCYVHSLSNHPPGIIKNIPVSINKRLCKISSSKEAFDNASKINQEELDKKGYKYKLEYNPDVQNKNVRKNRGRNITYFNPPFSKNVKTNVGAKFLKIISKNFPPSHPLSKVLNRNTIKISYRCMPNLKQHIDRHNAQVLNQDSNDQPVERCNCTANKKVQCPIPGRCATPSVVYRATVRRHDNCSVDCYTGLTGDLFKTRYSKHNSDIKLNKNTASKLANHVCNLKTNNIQHDISWEIVTRAPSYNPTSRMCRLCLTEAYYIMFMPGGANLNKRDELFGSCKHKWQKLLIKEKT